jgi:hypothetical protein
MDGHNITEDIIHRKHSLNSWFFNLFNFSLSMDTPSSPIPGKSTGISKLGLVFWFILK